MKKKSSKSSASTPGMTLETVVAGLEERNRLLEQELELARTKLQQVKEDRWILQALMKHVPEGISIATLPDFRIRTISRYGAEMTDHPVGEITEIEIPQHARSWGICHADGTPARDDELPLTRATMQGEEIRDEEWLLRRPDGQEMVAFCNAGPIFDDEGRIIGGVIAWRDINQIRLTKRTLKKVTEYRLALDSARLGTWEYHFPSARFTLGERCRTLFGTGEEQIGYDRFLALVHPEDRTLLDRKLRQAGAADHGGRFSAELRIVRPNGAVDWLLTHGQTVFAGTGEGRQAERLIGTVMDITEIKKAEQSLRESEERFRGTFENAAVGIAHLDLKGGFMRMNRRWCDLLGYGCDEMMRKTFMELIYPDDLEETLAHTSLLLAGEVDSFTMEKRYIHKNGQTIWGNLTESLQRDADNKPLFFISVIEDITVRKEAEAALRESQERLSLALNALQGGVWQMLLNPQAPDRMVDDIYISPQLKEVIGFGADDFPNSVAAWQARIHPDDCPRVDWIARQYLAGVLPDYRVEYRIRHRDGSWRWILSLGRLLRDPSGKPVRWAGVDLNITEQKNIEQELRMARQLADEASRAKDEFMANVSHELRTPMTIIMTSLQLLHLDKVEQRDYLLKVSDNAAHQLLAIIDDLLDFSLIETHELKIDKKPFELRSSVRKVADGLRDQAMEKSLLLDVQIAREVPETILGDRQRLEQILTNLIVNAVKFTEKGGVEVQVKRHGDMLVFSVLDTGIGIAEGKMSMLFEKFTQVDASSTRKYGGTGLGLAISKGLVELMGGEIRVESCESQGSVFSFAIPLESPE